MATPGTAPRREMEETVEVRMMERDTSGLLGNEERDKSGLLRNEERDKSGLLGNEKRCLREVEEKNANPLGQEENDAITNDIDLLGLEIDAPTQHENCCLGQQENDDITLEMNDSIGQHVINDAVVVQNAIESLDDARDQRHQVDSIKIMTGDEQHVDDIRVALDNNPLMEDAVDLVIPGNAQYNDPPLEGADYLLMPEDIQYKIPLVEDFDDLLMSGDVPQKGPLVNEIMSDDLQYCSTSLVEDVNSGDYQPMNDVNIMIGNEEIDPLLDEIILGDIQSTNPIVNDFLTGGIQKTNNQIVDDELMLGNDPLFDDDNDKTEVQESLPCIMLKFNDVVYPLFAPPPTSCGMLGELLFGDEYTPKSVEIITNGLSFNRVVFESALVFLLLELKVFLEISSDIGLKCKGMDLYFASMDLPVLKTLTVSRLFDYHMALSPDTTLTLSLIEYPNKLTERLGFFEGLCSKGGAKSNPIVLDSDIDEKPNIEHSDIDEFSEDGFEGFVDSNDLVADQANETIGDGKNGQVVYIGDSDDPTFDVSQDVPDEDLQFDVPKENISTIVSGIAEKLGQVSDFEKELTIFDSDLEHFEAKGGNYGKNLTPPHIPLVPEEVDEQGDIVFSKRDGDELEAGSESELEN